MPDGPLTQHLQKLQVGDQILVGKKPVGTLIADHLLPGKNLYLLSTGTGLAPFMSIIKDPEIYEQYDNVILTHGVRNVSELAYQEFIESQLQENEYFGELVKEKLHYYPTVTREEFRMVTFGADTKAAVGATRASTTTNGTSTVKGDRFM